mmetsp:Transcript_23829/g.30857  ORF Transcript_23829/g.30857 Transcript_23829/m.30857 type:complete len:254 (+) Transcript_23829:76-837(+)
MMKEEKKKKKKYKFKKNKKNKKRTRSRSPSEDRAPPKMSLQHDSNRIEELSLRNSERITDRSKVRRTSSRLQPNTSMFASLMKATARQREAADRRDQEKAAKKLAELEVKRQNRVNGEAPGDRKWVCSGCNVLNPASFLACGGVWGKAYQGGCGKPKPSEPSWAGMEDLMKGSFERKSSPGQQQESTVQVKLLNHGNLPPGGSATFVICPFNPGHRMPHSSLKWHMKKCPDNPENREEKVCIPLSSKTDSLHK